VIDLAATHAIDATLSALDRSMPIPRYDDVPEIEQLSERIRAAFADIDFAPYTDMQLRVAQQALRLCGNDIERELITRRMRKPIMPGRAQQPAPPSWAKPDTYGT
jgi:hypothetical protein